MRVRLLNRTRLSEFVGFLAAPQIALNLLGEDEIEILPTSVLSGESHEMFVYPILRAWNREHAEAAVEFVDESSP